ncbi:uncharacterized protein FA14DRAFT_158146 [Meira miltonrushii]|uniref:Uncharacterized protein n=1 Tax=Meira miltonrushii TaxID=1280837 RepID=A0A316V4N0_9BASI|nr:uncharacterized protein FA14DRAFT_158146 [Meira miltonrushii]PWN32214.1 hypothetical protein FA14DRAFT_158146 [Meira miltonrushii]
MKAFYFFLLIVITLMTLIDAMPLGKYFGRKKAVPAKSAASSSAGSKHFTQSEPNIAPHPPADKVVQHVEMTLENKKKYSKSIQNKKTEAVAAENKAWGKDPQAVINAQRDQHYAKHNEGQVIQAKTNGKMAITRSESGRNDVYHAVH